MIVLYIITAVFIAWIWVDYYRLIDIYEKESLWLLVLTFLLGCTSVFVVLGLNRFLLDDLPLFLNGNFFNDFLFCVFKIGFVEELAKTIPFIMIYYFFKDHINEPLDYLIYFSLSALGFSATENALYFQDHGPYIINNRAILSTVGHMFDTALIAYGVILYKFFHKKHSAQILILFFFLAALSHGFYDFWLIFEGTKDFGWIITILFFFITLSLFSAILNNALNNSGFFTYKKIVNPNKVITRLLTYFCIVFVIQLVLLTYTEGYDYAILNFYISIKFTGFIVFVTVVRLSRFKLIRNRWESLKFEFPFSIEFDTSSESRHWQRLSIKGDGFNETPINDYYEEFFYLNPLAPPSRYLVRARLAFIEKKLFLRDDKTFYLAKVYQNDEKGPYETMLLKAKTSGSTMVKGVYPIVALLKIKNLPDLDSTNATSRDFQFQEWATLKPLSEFSINSPVPAITTAM